MKVPGHKFNMGGQIGSLDHAKWSCECGQWSRDGTPVYGAWGSRTAKARIAQVQMAHGKHVRAVAAADAKVQREAVAA